MMITRGIRGLGRGFRNHVYRYLDKPMKPRWIWFGVTDACNCRCKFCNIWQNKPTSNMISVEEIRSAFTDPILSDLEYVVISGGEPCLRKDLSDLIIAINESHPKTRFTLSTNGTFPEIYVREITRLLDRGIQIDAGVSVDAIGEKRDEIRGVSGSFEKVDKLLKDLVELREKYDNLTISAALVLIDDTKESLDDVRDYLDEMGVGLNIQWYNQAEYYENVDKNLLTIDDRLQVIVDSQPPSPMRDRQKKFLKDGKLKFPCFSLYSFFVLKCNGDIAPCFELWDMNVGNIRENTFTEILHGEKAKELRGRVKACEGCLSDCGVEWSISTGYLPYFFHKSREIVGLPK